MRKDFDEMAKVAVIGDSAVGKTNLLLRYVSAVYHQSHTATIGIDFKVKTIQINGMKIKMQIWDTAGQERFRNLTSTIYQGAEAVILTYSIDSRRSFDSISKWMEDVKNYAKTDVIIGIIGNKCDLKSERVVSKDEGAILAKKIGAIFYETSALENINVEDIFNSIGQQLYKKISARPKPKKQEHVIEQQKPKHENNPSAQLRKSDKRTDKIVSKQKIVLDGQVVRQGSGHKRKKCC